MTDLDRYGLFALAVVILLILFVSLGKMEYGDEEAGATAPSSRRASPKPSAGGAAQGAPVAAAVRTVPAARGGFDFNEDPVPFAGGDEARTGEDPAVMEISEEVPERIPAPAAGEFILHRVRKGETLTSISKDYYGTESGWRAIALANGGLVPEKLMSGRMIRVPRKFSPLPAPSGGRSRAASPVRSLPARYVVRKNDTLAGISKRYYGTARKWRKIFEANRGRISDPDLLEVGLRLVLPP